jgi:hypothetical protein
MEAEQFVTEEDVAALNAARLILHRLQSQMLDAATAEAGYRAAAYGMTAEACDRGDDAIFRALNTASIFAKQLHAERGAVLHYDPVAS